MNIRKPTGPSRAAVFVPGAGAAVRGFLPSLSFVSLLAALLLAGCASPSEPLERKPLTPEAVTDLTVEQAGNDVILTFTLPKDSVDHRPLKDTPSIEIYRDVEAPAKTGEAIAAPANPTLLATIPEALTTQYAQQGRVRYADELTPSVFSSSVDRTAVYVVRTRVSTKRASANSNAASLQIFPAADAIADLRVEVTHAGIKLTWTPPQKDLAGNAVTPGGYRIYRAEELAAVPAAASAKPGGKPAELKMAPIGDAEPGTNMFLDTQIEFGNTYDYSVRSIVPYPGGELESADSNEAVVLAKDTFPPSAPENLVVAAVPAQAGAAARLELSWQISPEPDVVGYYLYRSEQSGVSGTRQNSELLLTPAFRDMNVVPGKRYFYTVTAVDRSGNESAPSSVVEGEVPAENPKP